MLSTEKAKQQLKCLVEANLKNKLPEQEFNFSEQFNFRRGLRETTVTTRWPKYGNIKVAMTGDSDIIKDYLGIEEKAEMIVEGVLSDLEQPENLDGWMSVKEFAEKWNLLETKVYRDISWFKIFAVKHKGRWHIK